MGDFYGREIEIWASFGLVSSTEKNIEADYEQLVRSSAWSFGHSDPDPSTVNGNAQEAVIFLLLMKAFCQQIWFAPSRIYRLFMNG